MTRFATVEEFREHVLTCAGSLPRQQRGAADYLLRHLKEFPFLSLPELAEQTGVSEPTIVRLAQSLGFSGFRDLKMELLQLPRETSGPLDAEIEPPSAKCGSVLHTVASLEIDNIIETVKLVDPVTLERVAKALHEADHTYVFGMGISSIPAAMARYMLIQVGVRCTLMSTDFTSPTEELIAVRSTDLVLAFSLPPFSRRTLEILRGARERGASTAVVTDGLGSPAIPQANWVLMVRTQNMMFNNALAAVIALVNALATQYALRHREESLAALAHAARSMDNQEDVAERLSELGEPSG